MPKLPVANIKELAGSKAAGDVKEAMQTGYYKPLVAELKRMWKAGEIDAETYKEIKSTYDRGKAEIRARVPRTEGHIYKAGNRSPMTDLWRAFGAQGFLGYRNFANEVPRAGTDGQIAGWYGVTPASTGPSNAGKAGASEAYPESRRPSWVNEDDMPDFYRDQMFRSEPLVAKGTKDLPVSFTT